MRRPGLVLLLLVPALPLAASARAGFKVDIGPDSPRRDLLTPGWHNWRLRDGPSATETFDGVTVTLRAAGPAGSQCEKQGADP